MTRSAREGPAARVGRVVSPPSAPVTAQLRVPADLAMVRLARLTATGMCRDTALVGQDVEDVRVAVDEACVALILGGTTALLVTLTASPDALEVVIASPDVAATAAISDLGGMLLDALVDEVEVTEAPQVSIRLVKRATPRERVPA